MSDGTSVSGLPSQLPQLCWNCERLVVQKERIVQRMSKSLDLISDAIRNPKHPFRQVDAQPDKPHKHRYERRKIKEYIKIADWMEEQKA